LGILLRSLTAGCIAATFALSAATAQTDVPPQTPLPQGPPTAVEPMQPPDNLPKPQRGDRIRNLDFTL